MVTDVVGWYLALLVLGLFAAAASVAAYWAWTASDRQAPVTQQTLVDALDDPILVVEADDTVAMTNTAFRSVFGLAGASTETDFRTVLAEYPSLIDAIEAEDTTMVDLEISDGQHSYVVSTYPVGEGAHPPQPRLVVFEDVTERTRLAAEVDSLTTHNERLQEFATLLAHDFRNPLDVAIGRTNAVIELMDDPELEEHLEHVALSHRRMQGLIEAVFELSRLGEGIEEPEPVVIDDIATRAWETVSTGPAGLEVDTELTVMGEVSQLLQLFENLYRNAVQHGGEAVTVRVSDHPTATGFTVSDDGCGIPEEKRERIFEDGYSGDSEGHGLGLSIVTKVATAHEWDVAVTDSESGGACFEFTGIEPVTEALPEG